VNVLSQDLREQTGQTIEKVGVRRANMLQEAAQTPRAQTSLAVSTSDSPLADAIPPPSTAASARLFISEKQRLQFGMMTHDSFGAYSPHWTIPSSRRPPKPENDFPGPGHYEVPPGQQDRGPKYAISPRLTTSDETATSKIDFFRPGGILDATRQTIGPVDGLHYYMPIPVSPAPSYVRRSFDGTKGITIGPKRPDIPPNAAPGPGRYSPTDINLLRNPHFEFPRTVERDPFGKSPDTPGPGAYETAPQPSAPKRWAGKLRVKTKRTRAKEAARDRPWAPRRRTSPDLVRPK
jgi:hypothetical protein